MVVSPLTKPEMITKPRTTRLMPVKILFTRADSLTPKARSPDGTKFRKRGEDRKRRERKDLQREERIHLSAPVTTCPAMWVDVFILPHFQHAISQ